MSSCSLSELLLRRSEILRADALDPARRGALLDHALEELATAAEELRVTEEELALQAADAPGPGGAQAAAGAYFDAAPDPLLVTDPAGVVRAANPAAAALLGVPRQRLPGKPLVIFVPPGDRREFRARLGSLADAGRTVRLELRLSPRGEEPLWAEAAVAVFASGTGAPELAWSLRDVTARRARERAQEEAVHTLRLALDAGAEAAAVLDVDGAVLHWTRAAERMAGWTEEEVVGRPLPLLEEGTGGAPAGTLPLRTPGGTLEVEARSTPLVDAEGRARGTRVVLAPPAPPARGAQERGTRSAWAEGELVRMVVEDAGTELVERIRGAIAAGSYLGRLRPGDRLPSIRELARRTGVDHRQVSAAYRRLEAEGAIEVRSRYGAVVAERPAACDAPPVETAAWLAGVAAEAAALQVKLPQLPELVRRWTAAGAVRCLCLEGTEDGRTALAAELAGRWGFVTEALPAGSDRATLGAALAQADLVATTPFHLAQVEPAARAAGVPVVVLTAAPEAVAALEDALARGEAAAVVADAAYGERLRGLRHGDRLRVVPAGDEAAVAALDPEAPVLLTRAAQQRLRRPLRLLAPVSPAFSSHSARELAGMLVHCCLRAERGGG